MIEYTKIKSATGVSSERVYPKYMLVQALKDFLFTDGQGFEKPLEQFEDFTVMDIAETLAEDECLDKSDYGTAEEFMKDAIATATGSKKPVLPKIYIHKWQWQEDEDGDWHWESVGISNKDYPIDELYSAGDYSDTEIGWLYEKFSSEDIGRTLTDYYYRDYDYDSAMLDPWDLGLEDMVKNDIKKYKRKNRTW